VDSKGVEGEALSSPKETSASSSTWKAGKHNAHSLYLQMGIDLGIPGLVAGMALISAFLLIGISAMQRARHTRLEGVAAGAMGGFVVYLVHGLVDNITFSAKPGMVLWTIVGLATAVWLRFKGP
jgi:putative inorganic carbon (HCO3(-)) transporter